MIISVPLSERRRPCSLPTTLAPKARATTPSVLSQRPRWGITRPNLSGTPISATLTASALLLESRSRSLRGSNHVWDARRAGTILRAGDTLACRHCITYCFIEIGTARATEIICSLGMPCRFIDESLRSNWLVWHRGIYTMGGHARIACCGPMAGSGSATCAIRSLQGNTNNIRGGTRGRAGRLEFLEIYCSMTSIYRLSATPWLGQLLVVVCRRDFARPLYWLSCYVPGAYFGTVVGVPSLALAG